MRELWAFRPDVASQGADLSGMAVQALDGGMGKVREVVDRDSRTFLVVDSGPWVFGKTIKVPAGLVSGIDLNEGVVLVDRRKDDVQGAPEHEGELVDDAAHEEAITRYYGFERGDTRVATRPEPQASAATAPGDLPAAAPHAEEGASRSAAVTGIEPIAPRRDEERARAGDSLPDRTGAEPIAPRRDEERPQPGDSVPDRTGAEPQSTLKRADSAEVAPIPAGNVARAADSDGPQERRAKPAGGDDTANASPWPATTTPDSSARDAAASPTAKGIGALPPEDRRSEAPTRTSRRGPEPSPERSRSAAAPARTRADEPSTAKAAAPARKRPETPSRTESARGTAKRTKQGPRASGNDQPLARYDALTAAEVVARLRSLSQSELTKVERYERRGGERQTILKRVAALREKEPWRGYDGANVKEVREKLAKAKADRATAVRDYERRHRNRAGVMEAARRRLEDL